MINISKVTSEKKVYKILNDFDKEFIHQNNKKQLEKLSKKISKNGITIISKIDDDIAGFCSFYCNDLDSKTGYITKIAVKEKYRGKGVGKQIISEAEKISKENQMEKMMLEVYNQNSPAITLYTKCGYTFKENASTDSKYMEKSLTIKK